MNKLTKLPLALSVISSLFFGVANAENVDIKANVIEKNLLEVPVSKLAEGGSIMVVASTAYMDEAFNTPTIYYGNQWYYGEKLSSPVYVSSSSDVTAVTWEWTVNKTVSNTIVYLCSLTTSGSLSKCGNVSSIASGSTSTFFDSEKAAGGFKFIFAVDNGGSYVNMIANKTKVIVTHN